ncbi:methionyl-tRNA formyltransferase [Collinsella sp. AGMB00827]|uniref:Methionyl-tRNA formyltransferase n=1 Tax=Collinsella ureilytica TaxID=2869515 RepID=A0ABS7MIB7_9ACTN|nr:methionyl-tRNA formyltransferase [Collinsella urealyticum]MBY4796836.1 methionyl-tRNA formyltransferase [Collinsella urealyticum]
MRIVFMGTPTFAVPAFQRLADTYEVALVLTRPDAVRGRGRKLVASPVKLAAQERGIQTLECSRCDDGVISALAQVEADVFCVAAFGCILPEAVLQLVPAGCVNVHASLLPRWRGAAPIQRSILAGDEETGVSIMRIEAGLDTGPYCAQARCSALGKTADELTGELAEMGAALLVEQLPAICEGRARWIAQDENHVTHAAKITKAEMRLNPEDSASVNLRRILASNDAAPARAQLDGISSRVLFARPSDESLEPGELRAQAGRLVAGTRDGAFEIVELKPDGKRAMDARAWLAGRHVETSRWSALS